MRTPKLIGSRRQVEKKLKILDFVDVGYLNNIGYRVMLYSPMQEGRLLNKRDDFVKMATCDYINSMYQKNPDQFLNIRRNKKYPATIPLEAMMEAWRDCDETIFERWVAKNQKQAITQELNDAIEQKPKQKKTLKI